MICIGYRVDKGLGFQSHAGPDVWAAQIRPQT